MWEAERRVEEKRQTLAIENWTKSCVFQRIRDKGEKLSSYGILFLNFWVISYSMGLFMYS